MKKDITVKRKFLCFGDSLTELGTWVDRLDASPLFSALNCGQSGRRMTESVEDFRRALMGSCGVTDLLIMIGVNDLCARVPGTPEERLQSLISAMESALEIALDHFAPGQIYLIAPPSVNADLMNKANIDKGYLDNVLLMPRLADSYRLIAEEFQINFSSCLDCISPENLEDGLHPNEAGNDELYSKILGFITQPRLHLVGDSISIDYHESLDAFLEDSFHFSRKGGLELARADLDMVQGANGGNSQQVLDYLKTRLERGDLKVDWIAWNCGLHDIRTDPASGRRAVELEHYESNLIEIIGTIRRLGACPVWINTTHVDDDRHNQNLAGFQRFNANVVSYNQAASEVMQREKVPIIDLNQYSRSLPEPHFRDHVHFAVEHHERQAQFLAKALRRICFFTSSTG